MAGKAFDVVCAACTLALEAYWVSSWAFRFFVEQEGDGYYVESEVILSDQEQDEGYEGEEEHVGSVTGGMGFLGVRIRNFQHEAGIIIVEMDNVLGYEP